MLVILRYIGQSFLIGEINFIITGVFNKIVRLGVINKLGISEFSTLEAKLEEEIRITEDIKIKVLQIRGRQVRLGIKAPPEILVLRDELLK